MNLLLMAKILDWRAKRLLARAKLLQERADELIRRAIALRVLAHAAL